MKKILTLFIGLLLVTACSKQSAVDEPTDKWNGYQKYLKTGEMYHTLWAGKNINVGTATYGIDDNANFYVTYDCSASGWTISETHMFAGDKKSMPLNKPGNPKIGQFPNSGSHNPNVSSYTYTVPLTSLPPCEEPGFVVAAHCCVLSPSGQNESAWAEGEYKFTDKGWGWYDIYFYNQPPNQFTILYGTAYDSGYLKLYHMDMTNVTTTLILEEYIGEGAGKLDGTAYDVESGLFFFTNYNTNELYVNDLNDVSPSESAGILNGTAASGTFYNGMFYYVGEGTNTINQVSFTSDWLIAGEVVLDTIPGTVAVNDIAMSLDGSYLYMIAQVDGGGTELIRWDTDTGTFYSLALTIEAGAQIAYGSDGELYAIAPIVDVSGYSTQPYIVNTTTGTLTEIVSGSDGDGIGDDDDPIEDPRSRIDDISGGPIL